ncbi:hypothetical protein [Bradyrhizobium sp. 139]|uniref:hypothetical protein n=1 Tax=Bradyrhizobium sp. 139 TaxID=2782616 RepID=UPI001FF732CF|nr:hypothetical protein [Bradyrhizobium sp. 139]
MRISAGEQPTAAWATLTASDLIQFARPIRIVLRRLDFFAHIVVLLSERLPYGICRMRCGSAFAEKRYPMPSNRKLVFNIRISTEAEINGTVKGVV